MFYIIDKFDTFITHLIKLCMQSRQEPTMYADVTWIFSTLLIKISSFTSHWADLLWSNKTCSTEKTMLEPNSILWKFETQRFFQAHVGEISRKRGQEQPEILLQLLFGWECSGSTQEVWLYLWDILHWAGDISWTGVVACGIPVATVPQDLGERAQGSWWGRPNPRKVLRKANLFMDWHFMFKYLCNNKPIEADSRTLSDLTLFAQIPVPTQGGSLFICSSSACSNNQLSPLAAGTGLSLFVSPLL